MQLRGQTLLVSKGGLGLCSFAGQKDSAGRDGCVLIWGRWGSCTVLRGWPSESAVRVTVRL